MALISRLTEFYYSQAVLADIDTDIDRPRPTVGCGDQSLDGASGMNIIVC